MAGTRTEPTVPTTATPDGPGPGGSSAAPTWPPAPGGRRSAELSRQLPWLLVLAGVVLTAPATRAGHQLARGRQAAEQDAATITALYERTETLFDQQRELFVSLQRALLPHVDPLVPNLEIASEYVAGARGLDIGGDWYSIIALDGTASGSSSVTSPGVASTRSR